MIVDKNALDVAQIFQTYLAFCGDVDRTAVALHLTREQVRFVAERENWSGKIREWNAVRESGGPEAQVFINRAINYVQAHRLRSVLDKLVSHLSEMPPDDLVENLSQKGKDGSRTFSTRALTDLVKAAEAVQGMTCRALGDTPAERPEEAKTSKGSSVALMVMNAMSAADTLGLSSMEVVRKELDLPK